MQNANQTKNAGNGNDRDAAIQIPAEGESKFSEIYYGVIRKFLGDAACKEEDFWHTTVRERTAAVSKLAMIIAELTSSNKEDREWAKKEVRELVKLGREQSTFNQGDMK